VIARVYRDVRDRPLRVRVPVRVTYSRSAVGAFVRRVSRAVDKQPRDARLVPGFASLTKVPSVDGVAVRKRLLERRIGAHLLSPKALHATTVPVRVVEPSVTTKGLARKYPYFITISRWTKELRLYRNLRPAKKYRIAVGGIGYDTPGGLYRVETKAINPAWHVPNSEWTGDLAGKIIPGGVPENPLKARWMGFYNGAGIHGTDAIYSLGSAASHGCIRMSIPDVIELYDTVPLHTPIFIA
jgi:lipoprotein-anchoring transpeptidase ErfK/SrfK